MSLTLLGVSTLMLSSKQIALIALLFLDSLRNYRRKLKIMGKSAHQLDCKEFKRPQYLLIQKCNKPVYLQGFFPCRMLYWQRFNVKITRLWLWFLPNSRPCLTHLSECWDTIFMIKQIAACLSMLRYLGK